MNWAFAALLLLALNASGQVRTFALGGVEHAWEGGGDGMDPEFLFGSSGAGRRWIRATYWWV